MSNFNTPPTNHVRVLDGGQGWVGLLDHMGDESTITNAARVSFGKMKTSFDDNDVKLLSYLIENSHSGPLEHVKFSFSVHCPLFVRGQWHRHRMASINEISRRYTEVDTELYLPTEYRLQSTDNKQASEDELVPENEKAMEMVEALNKEALAVYEQLLEMGVCREQARGVLPQSAMTTYWWTIDLRNLLHFFELRDDSHAQKEIRVYAKAMKQLVEPIIPHVAEYFKSKGKW